MPPFHHDLSQVDGLGEDASDKFCPCRRPKCLSAGTLISSSCKESLRFKDYCVVRVGRERATSSDAAGWVFSAAKSII